MARMTARQRGQCSATGPIAPGWKPHLQCTDYSGHDYAHHDATQDVSWTDDAHDDVRGLRGLPMTATVHRCQDLA